MQHCLGGTRFRIYFEFKGKKKNERVALKGSSEE